MPPPPSSPPLLAIFVRLCATAHLLRIYTALAPGTLNMDQGRVGVERSGIGADVTIVVAALCLACYLPARPLVAASALALRAVTNLSKGGSLGNSQTWGAYTDCALVASLVGEAASSKVWLRPLDAPAQRRVVYAAAPCVLWQLVLFYSASGFWKINSSFLRPEYSCGAMFSVQLAEWLPDALAFRVAPLLAIAGPSITLGVEHLIPLAQAASPAAGVAATVVFHLLIGLSPCPCNISSFGATLVPRVFLLLPEEAAAASGEAGTRALAVAAAALVAAATRPMHVAAVSCLQGTGLDVNLVCDGCASNPDTRPTASSTAPAVHPLQPEPRGRGGHPWSPPVQVAHDAFSSAAARRVAARPLRRAHAAAGGGAGPRARGTAGGGLLLLVRDAAARPTGVLPLPCFLLEWTRARARARGPARARDRARALRTRTLAALTAPPPGPGARRVHDVLAAALPRRIQPPAGAAHRGAAGGLRRRQPRGQRAGRRRGPPRGDQPHVARERLRAALFAALAAARPRWSQSAAEAGAPSGHPCLAAALPR